MLCAITGQARVADWMREIIRSLQRNRCKKLSCCTTLPFTSGLRNDYNGLGKPVFLSMIPDSGRNGRLVASLFGSIHDKRCWQRLTAFKSRPLVILLAGQVIPYKVPGSISSCVDASDICGCFRFPHHIAMGIWISHCYGCSCFHAWHVRCFGRCR